MNISLNKEVNSIRNNTMFKGCIHKDANCTGVTSKAHSVQNNGYLNSISTDGNVLCIDFGKLGLNKKLELHSVGRGKASIFTGFCNYHDSNIFKPIEGKNGYQANNEEQNFLFAYRAFALAYYERHSAYEFMKEHLEIERKKTKENIKEFEEKLAFYKKHLKLIENLRISMNINLDNRRYDRVSTELLIWQQNYELAATSMFFIDKDKDGRVVNDPSVYISPFFLTIIPQNDKTYVLMSYLSKDRHRYEFIKEQIVDTEVTEQKILISNMLAMNVENFFISPDRWNTLSLSTRELFMRVLESTIGKNKPRIGYFNDLNLFN